MNPQLLKKIRKLNLVTHRDLGYIFSSLIVIYCISGIALNHVDDWNPDFIVDKKVVSIPARLKAGDISASNVKILNDLVGEEKFKVVDAPTHDQIKIYYDNASFHVNFSTHEGNYEKITRRALFYHVNVLHKNSLKGWKWAADLFAVILILISITGLFILKGKHGFSRRGVWLMLAGFVPPILAWIIHAYIQ